MAVEILMPELGESVHEGTVSRWLKKVGDFVKEDEPIVEILTDKVNTELPAPASGILSQILIQEGDTVLVFAAMGVIDDGATAATTTAPASPIAQVDSAPEVKTPLAPNVVAAEVPAPVAEGDKRWVTPLVRSMMKENGIPEEQIAAISGTGDHGRVTKKDIEAYLAVEGKATPAAAPVVQKIESKPAAPTVVGPDQTLTPLAGMRKMIADHMIRSSQIPTVSTVCECDVTSMVQFRDLNKEAFLAQNGVKLTYTPFFIKALAESLAEFPLVNSQLTPDNQILSSKGVHMGIAVALGAKGDEGLIVPVIKDCNSKNLVEVARELDAIAKKARANKLGLTDIQGGTFTLTNPGTYGALFGTPMINAPQSGILGVYSIKKQPVIINDMIAIRSILHLVLTYDHRLIDGMIAGKFLASVRDRLQNFDFFK